MGLENNNKREQQLGRRPNQPRHASGGDARSFRALSMALGLSGLLAAGAAAPTPAAACGGFFCSQVPVNQAAEEILFIDNGDGTVTTVIEIEYVGPSERFAWLLPIPGDPEIAVSSGLALSRLAQATNPQYNLDTTVEGECKDDTHLNPRPLPPFAVADTAAAVPGSASGGVTVVSSGEVGPYVYATISLDESLAMPEDAAITWLRDNGYDVPDGSGPLLGPYLADGLNLLAVKLTKGSDQGSIRPLMLTYEAAKPMIPIKPTAVAAELDMGLQVYVAGQNQAIPLNYKGLILNEALIDWVAWNNFGNFGFGGPVIFPGPGGPTGGPMENYRDVVSAAADEAGGQGFVTEFAGASQPFEETIFGPADRQQWDDYQAGSYADGFEAMTEASWRYRTWDGWRDAIRESVTLPMSVAFDDFGRNPDQYRDVVQIDQQRFLELLYERVVKPMIDTQEALNRQPYLTRMFSTISPEEMTMDPVFSYNVDLMDVDNVHTANQIIECSPDVLAWEAPWRIELPQGGVITGKGSDQPWPITLADGVPAALRIVDVAESGGGMIVDDNAEALEDLLEEMTGVPQDIPEVPVMEPGTDDMPSAGGRVPLGSGGPTVNRGDGMTPPTLDDPAGGATSGGDSSGCAVRKPGQAGGSAWLALWAGLAVVMLRRRARAAERDARR